MTPDHVTANLESFSNTTIVHPVGATVLILLAIWVMVCKRQWVPIAYLLLACLAARQRIAIASLDFTFIRMLILVGWARILMTGEIRKIRWMALDGAVIAWTAVAFLAYTVLVAAPSGAVYMAGQTIDTLGAYVLFRALLRNWDDVANVARYAAWIALPLGVAFLIEKSSGRNMFYVFGGIPQFTPIREGELRCQGAFVHPILAGVFWATLLPLIVGLGLVDRRRRLLSIAGTVAGLVIVVSTASSTPLAAVAGGVLVAAAFPLRNLVGYLKWAALGAVVFLHFAMAKPVWHLIGRVDLVGGSTGYQRYRLIDAFVNHFDEWWLYGTPSTAHWGRQLFDVTNQYVLEGVRGGVLRLMLFLAVLVLAFRCIGKAVDKTSARRESILAWAVGASLFISMASFMAVSYFGAIVMLWHLLLALAATVGEGARRPATKTRAARKTTTRRVRRLGSQPLIGGAPA